MEPIKNCMILQKDSLFIFWLDNLPSISGSKLYTGLLPVENWKNNIQLTERIIQKKTARIRTMLLEECHGLPFLDNS